MGRTRGVFSSPQAEGARGFKSPSLHQAGRDLRAPLENPVGGGPETFERRASTPVALLDDAGRYRLPTTLKMPHHAAVSCPWREFRWRFQFSLSQEVQRDENVAQRERGRDCEARNAPQPHAQVAAAVRAMRNMH